MLTSRIERLGLALRVPFLLLSFVVLIWWTLTLPAFWSALSTKDVAARVVAGDRFKPALLRGVLILSQPFLNFVVERSELVRVDALIRLQLTEETTGKESQSDLDREAIHAEERLKSSLTLNPTDSFAWLMLYSSGMGRGGFDAKALGYLHQSYLVGPQEGWIALRRNRLALAAFSLLDSDTQARVVFEFACLVGSEFTETAALNLITNGWEQRDRLLKRLSGVDIFSREALAKRLVQDGVKVVVPGVVIDDRFLR